MVNALLTGQQLFELSLNAISVHTLVTDDSGRPIDYIFDAVNPAFEAFTGLRGVDLVGRRVLEVLPDTEMLWIERYGRVVQTGEPATFSSYSQELDKWFKVSAFRHSALGFTVTFIDVTDVQKEHLAALEVEKRYRSLFEMAPVKLVVDPVTLAILDANAIASEFYGWSLEELKSMRIDQLNTAPMSQVQSAVNQVKDLKRNVFEFQHRLKDGSNRFVSLFSTPGQWKDREVLVSTILDTTEQINQSRQLKLGNVALAAVSQGVIITGTDQIILFANQAFLRISGYAESEVVGMNCRFLQGPETSKETISQIRASLQQETEFSGEILNYRKDGSSFWNELTISPVATSEGVVTHFVGITRDVTYRKAAEKARLELERQLHQSQKMEGLGVLASGVAHDMNNVLAAISATASIQRVTLADEGFPASGRLLRAFESIERAVVRGSAMVSGLLNFTRQGLAESVMVQWNEVIREQVALLETTLLSRIALRAELSETLPVMVGNPTDLSHALMNICLNARDSLLSIPLPDRPKTQAQIVIRSALKDGGVQIEVSDNGPGMTPEVMARACDPFFTTKPVGEGTGLGLAMVTRIVQAHQGRVSLESQPGQVTTVAMWFPRASKEGA